LYTFFSTDLKEESYNAMGSAPTTENHPFDMSHARIDDNDKHTLLKSLAAHFAQGQTKWNEHELQVVDQMMPYRGKR
jgi:hypothetical protein